MKNLDRIAAELFNKIRGRFPNVTIGDESGNITNVPESARYYDFSYVSNGEDLGKVSVGLDEDNGITVIVSKDLVQGQMEDVQDGWYNVLRELRMFSKKRLLSFDVRDINKKQLSKKDYHYLAKNRSGEDQMNESKMYGNKTTSYQKIGNARLVIKHSAPITAESSTSRTQKIKSIYIESPDGERFKYPYKHLSGARAMARHVSEGGNAYDDFGKYISGLSEEVSKLRKFNQYLNRSSVMAETLSEYTDIVKNRVNEVKKEIQNLQKDSYYQEAVANFTPQIVEDVPEEVAENWIDQLTVKQFNEELKDIFPFVYRLVGEATRAKELSFEDLIAEGNPCWDGYEKVPGKKDYEKGSCRKKTREEQELEDGFEEMMGQFSEKSDHNFTGDDLNRLARIKDLDQAKKYALQLITADSNKPMKPEKVKWFKNALIQKKSVMDVVKMMYDMLLSGDGMGVIGTSGGMGKNSYRKKFGEKDAAENYPDGMNHSYLDDDGEAEYAYDEAKGEMEYNVKHMKDAEFQELADPANYDPEDVDDVISDMSYDMAADFLKGRYSDWVVDAIMSDVADYAKQLMLKRYQAVAKQEDEMPGAEEKPKTPLPEFILSYFDRETGQFPKGETAVLTMVQKEYGDNFVIPAKRFIEMVNDKVSEVMGFGEPEDAMDEKSRGLLKKMRGGHSKRHKLGHHLGDDTGDLDRIRGLAGL